MTSKRHVKKSLNWDDEYDFKSCALRTDEDYNDLLQSLDELEVSLRIEPDSEISTTQQVVEYPEQQTTLTNVKPKTNYYNLFNFDSDMVGDPGKQTTKPASRLAKRRPKTQECYAVPFVP